MRCSLISFANKTTGIDKKAQAQIFSFLVSTKTDV